MPETWVTAYIEDTGSNLGIILYVRRAKYAILRFEIHPIIELAGLNAHILLSRFPTSRRLA